MNWQDYSLFHILKKRWNTSLGVKNPVYFYRGKINFLSHISDVDKMSDAIMAHTLIISIIASLLTGLNFWQFLLLQLTFITLVVGMLAAIDTYYTRKNKIRQEAKKSITAIITGHRPRF